MHEAIQKLQRKWWCEQETRRHSKSQGIQWESKCISCMWLNWRTELSDMVDLSVAGTSLHKEHVTYCHITFACWKMLSADPPFQLHCPCLDHAWDYNTHHVHPVDFENLAESHFTELQSVQPLHASNVHRFPEVESGHFLDPGLTGHHLTLPPPQVRPAFSIKHLLINTTSLSCRSRYMCKHFLIGFYVRTQALCELRSHY